MALSRVVSEIFNVEKCHDIVIPVRDSQGQKVVPFDRLFMIYLLVIYSNFVPKSTIFEVFDLKPGLGSVKVIGNITV